MSKIINANGPHCHESESLRIHKVSFFFIKSYWSSFLNLVIAAADTTLLGKALLSLTTVVHSRCTILFYVTDS